MKIAELRELLAKAWPAPWRTDQGTEGEEDAVVALNPAYPDEVAPVAECSAECDARLIAALRNEAPALLDRVEALRAALLTVSTDNAQDALEDPVGHAAREADGYYRIGTGAMNEVRAALGKGESRG